MKPRLTLLACLYEQIGGIRDDEEQRLLMDWWVCVEKFGYFVEYGNCTLV